MEYCGDVRKIKVADFIFAVGGNPYVNFIGGSRAFELFETDGNPDFKVIPDGGLDAYMLSEEFAGRRTEYEIGFEDISCEYGKVQGEVFFFMRKATSEALLLLWTPGSVAVRSSVAECPPSMLRFALWMAFNMLTIPHGCAAVHSSVNVSGGFAAMFLGESGTGKSTHTRLLRERYAPDMSLLNDDSPFVRAFEDGRVVVYGSPWSGKTPCYKTQSFPLKAIVRLSQAPFNRIRKLSPLQAIGALLPSAPPAFNYVGETSDMVCSFVSSVVSSVGAYHLECLPDTAAAELSYNTIFAGK